MHKRPLAFALALALISSACTEETPTDVGDDLLPSGDVLTFEVVLPASAFLLADSSFSGFNKPPEAVFGVIANRFENVFDANTLLRFSLPPRTVSVRTTGTTIVVDSQPRFSTGRMVVKFDTLHSTVRPVKLALYRTAEEWDISATWPLRVDTLGVKLPWMTPGGTRGAQIDTATWAAGDSVIFNVDSATIAIWNDSTNRARGAILTSGTDGSRIRMLSTTVRIDTRSTVRPDTALTVDVVPTFRTFVSNPTLTTPSGGIRVGGLPTWRAFIRFRDDLGSLVVPCNNGQSSCSVRLDSVHINRAQLLLRPAVTPVGFVPEDSVYIEARPILTGPTVPLERSPLGTFAGSVISRLMPASLFRAPTAADVVTLDVTQFLAHQFDETVTAGNRLPFILALLQFAETTTVGFATFEEGPMLRLILTTTTEGR
jgi:hypothetical protein